jgi:hypothetical protein
MKDPYWKGYQKSTVDEQHRPEGRHNPVVPHSTGNIETQQVRTPQTTQLKSTEERMKKHIDRVMESIRNNSEFLGLQEKVKNAYAIGMAQAMKSTGDKPPLEKSTITKAHEIAKSVAKEEVELDEELRIRKKGHADWDIVNRKTGETHSNYKHAGDAVQELQKQGYKGRQLRPVRKGTAARYGKGNLKEENQQKERPYVAVHAKKGTHETHATSSYDAAKKAAAHWKLKSTDGIDSHLADVKHIAREQVEQIDEISKKVIGSYLKKASHDIAGKTAEWTHLSRNSKDAYDRGDAYQSKRDMQKSDEIFNKSWERRKKMAKAVDRLTKEDAEQIDELSKNTLASYAKKAHWAAAGIATAADRFRDSAYAASDRGNTKDAGEKMEWSHKLFHKSLKRHQGTSRAIDRLAKEEVEQIDEGHYFDGVSSYDFRQEHIVSTTARKQIAKARKKLDAIEKSKSQSAHTKALKSMDKQPVAKFLKTRKGDGKVHTEEVEQIDEGTMQKQKSDFTSPKYRYRSDAPHMGSYKLRAGTYRTGDDSYDDKDETKVSHSQGRKMTKKLRSAPSAEERSRLWNKFWKTGSMKEEVEQVDEGNKANKQLRRALDRKVGDKWLKKSSYGYFEKKTTSPLRMGRDVSKYGQPKEYGKLAREEVEQIDEVDMGQADRTLRTKSHDKKKWNVVHTKTGKTVSTHDNQGDAIRSANKHGIDDHKLDAVKEAVQDATTPSNAQETLGGVKGLAKSLKDKKKSSDKFDPNPEFVSQVQPNASNY